MRWSAWPICLLLCLSSIPLAMADNSLSMAARAAGVEFAPPGLSARFCAASGSRVTPHAMTVARDRLLHRISALAPSQATAAKSGSRCIGLSIRGSLARPSVARMLMEPGSLVIADSGNQWLTRGMGVRVLSRSARSRLKAQPPALRLVVSLWGNTAGTATTQVDSIGMPAVIFGLKRLAASTWCAYTRSHVTGFAAFVLDNRVLEDPQIQSPICGGSVQVVGLRSTARAKMLAAYINFGPLPISFQETSTRG